MIPPNLPDDDIAPFRAIEISRLAHQMEAQGASVLHLEFGQPTAGAPSAAIATAHKVLDSDAMGYWESPALKARLAKSYDELYGVTVDPEEIVLTCGASPALVLALRAVFKPGDRVVLARPGYVAYRNVLKALNLVPIELPCGPNTRYQLTAERLESVLPEPEGVILSSPANPTGAIIPPADMERLAALCAERSIQIVSDEIYHNLVYEGRAASALEFASDALIINSFSKYYAMAGWRLGWLVAKGAALDKARALMGNLFLTAPSLAQHAGLAALDARAELDVHLAGYARNRQRFLQALPEMGLTQVAPPDGAFYIYADVGHLTDKSLDLCRTILSDTGVATAPGVDFDPVSGARFIRFSFAVSDAECEEALARLIPWFQARSG